MRKSFVGTVLPVWLVTAAWDFLCASALSVFAYHTTFARLWQGVASAVLGPSALDGGITTVAAAYGPIIWLVMSLVVIPLATGRPPQFGFRWWVQIFAHVPFVTIPLVFTARRVLLGLEPLSTTARSAQSAA